MKGYNWKMREGMDTTEYEENERIQLENERRNGYNRI